MCTAHPFCGSSEINYMILGGLPQYVNFSVVEDNIPGTSESKTIVYLKVLVITWLCCTYVLFGL
jgi:hypothetical protein